MRGFMAVAVLLGMTSFARADAEVVLRCGDVIDGISQWALGASSILVRDGRIAGMAPDLEKPSGAKVIDLSEATCLPGLIDTHVHLMFEKGDLEKQILNESSAWKALKGLQNAQKMLQAGFTTIRIPGDADRLFAPVDLKRAVEGGLVRGPRIFVSAHALSSTGGHGDLGFLAPEIALRGPAVADGVEEIRRMVRREIKFGSDWIKIMATGGFLSAHDDPDHAPYTLEELRAAVETAERLGVKVTAHAHGAEGIKLAVRAGVRSIDHGTFIDSQGLELMEREGVFLIPTFHVIDTLTEPGTLNELPAYSADKVRRFLPRLRESRRRIAESKVRIAFGTDVGIFDYSLAAREFSAMVSAGIDPMRALQAATSTAADLLDRSGEIGGIREGYFADIIAVRGNPLEEIAVLEDVGFVMKGGEVVKNDF